MKTIDSFTKEYGMLHDAVIKSLSLAHSTNPSSTIIKMELECMSLLKNDEWICLFITFHDIVEFKIFSSHQYPISSIENFCVSLLEDKIIFDFIPHVIYPSTIEQHRESLFYIVFKTIDFSEAKLD